VEHTSAGVKQRGTREKKKERISKYAAKWEKMWVPVIKDGKKKKRRTPELSRARTEKQSFAKKGEGDTDSVPSRNCRKRAQTLSLALRRGREGRQCYHGIGGKLALPRRSFIA